MARDKEGVRWIRLMMLPSLRSHHPQRQQMQHCAQVLPRDQHGAALIKVIDYQSTGVLVLREQSSVLGDHNEAVCQGNRLPRWKNTAGFPT